MKLLLPIFISLVSIKALAQEGGTDIVIGKSHVIHSKILNEKRHYAVYLPDGYSNKSSHPKNYPVMYVLDGESHFHSASGIVDVRSPFYLPQMIVVAIGNTDRWRDLTPTSNDSLAGSPNSGVKTTGGGEAFLKFIEKELVPHIEETYRTTPYRLFVGHSLGGLTALYSAYFQPKLFNAYIVIDPSLQWDHFLMLKKFEEEAMQTKLANKSFFISESKRKPEENPAFPEFYTAFDKMLDIFRASKTPGLRWRHEEYKSETHGSVPLLAEIAGLDFIFDNYRINIESDSPEAAKLKTHFERFSEDLHFSFPPPEVVVNVMAYNFMVRKEYDKALECYLLNIENYPKSSSAYLTVGDIYRDKKGDRKKALEYYERYLKINPGATMVKNRIRSLGQQ
ncbi:alpha/beta hydrolase-fold protein [Imperialibacter roseus]|uniref:Alpha/beta hydrolase-fold protein n=1 Tax=Imperialibacter roseus TaxID=1324217 RepID=A0ABZ0IJF8_9BACT|nr:alpha/beta hydrolase-fold protein [Imperialibacter roseus]WOK04644.1 alpha/beta hydrolase-fold protein [Imperialibacter roseus]